MKGEDSKQLLKAFKIFLICLATVERRASSRSISSKTQLGTSCK